MTLEEFISELKNDIDSFETRWKEGQKKEPSLWPNELGEGDWLDQFITHLQEKTD
jgi:hypothetical protein